MQAMIFAAGMGTRLKPLTDFKPKALVEVKGKTLIEHAIAKLISSGADKIIINIHHFSKMIRDFLSSKDFDVEIIFSDETDLLRDTGGGLKYARQFFGEKAFILYNVDIFGDIDLRQAYEKHTSDERLASIVVRKRETSRYLLFNKNLHLCGWENIHTGEQKIPVQEEPLIRYAFSGIHIINPEIFSLMPEMEVFSIIDLYLLLAKDHIISAHIDTSRYWFDLGRPEHIDTLNKTAF